MTYTLVDRLGCSIAANYFEEPAVLRTGQQKIVLFRFTLHLGFLVDFGFSASQQFEFTGGIFCLFRFYK